ncbi:restriction endonuclease subunit S [Mycoplasma sp. 4079]|uniref:restriction endonuclease subunit S n=1 Tax=Mycoplasma sp. 4079 TaxID=3398615 RepID=UPI0039FDDB63
MSENKLNLDFIDNLLPKNEFKSIEVKKLSDVVLLIDENRLEISEFISQDGDINPAIIKSNDKSILTNKYLHHFLRTKSNLIHKLVKDKSDLIDFNLLKVLDIDITIPSINCQNKIIETIENLEKVCYELEVDLSSDHSEKQKQLKIYEKLIFEYLESESFDELTEKISDKDTIVNLIKLIQFIFNTTITIHLSKIAKFFRGESITKNFIENNPGEYPVYSSQTTNNGEFGKINTYKYDGEYVSWTTDGVYAGTAFYRTGKFNITSHCGSIETDKSLLLPKYLYFYLSVNLDKYVNKSSPNPLLTVSQISEVKVTFPNLETQKHIANILDIFSSYAEKLKAELKAELKARSTQYEYYRDKLLSNNNLSNDINSFSKKLSEIAEVSNTGIDKKILENEKRVSILNYLDVFNNNEINKAIPGMIVSASENEIEKCNILKGDIFITPSSETIAEIAKSAVVLENLENCLYSYHICRIRLFKNNLVTSKFLNYYINSSLTKKYFTKKAKGSQRYTISKKDIEDLTICLPDLNTQEKIVKVLDNFESICKDLKIGLPAEEIKRQQQYEFYRDSIFEYLETNSFEKLMRERERERR